MAVKKAHASKGTPELIKSADVNSKKQSVNLAIEISEVFHVVGEGEGLFFC
jgi:hypothetical protein